MTTDSSSTIKWAAYCIIIISCCLLLYFAGNIVLPFILSLFIAILLLPVVEVLKKIYIPTWLGALIAMALVGTVILAIGFFLYIEMDVMIKELPVLVKEKHLLSNTDAFIQELDIQQRLQNVSAEVIRNSTSYLKNVLTYLSSTLAILFLIPVYVFFMLINSDRVSAYVKERYKNKSTRGYYVIELIRKSIQRYTFGLLMVMFIVGILISAGLWIIGIPYWPVLGMLAALLGLFPYVGIVLGALLPVTIAYLTKDSYWYPISVVLLFVFIQFLEGNLITPKVVGNAVNINPVALMLALLIVGSLSGILGLILTIPMMGVLRILMEQSNELRPFAKLLANSDE